MTKATWSAEAEREVWIEAMHDHIRFWKSALEGMSDDEYKYKYFERLVLTRLDTVEMVKDRADAIRKERTNEDERWT